MLGRGVNEEIMMKSPEEFWGDTLPVLSSADCVVANLECAITTHRQVWQGPPKAFYFRADPEAVEVLKAGNVRCVCLANNHTLDYEVEGLLETARNLDGAGIARAGGGRNQTEAEAPAIFEAAGVKLGFIGMTDNEPSFGAGKDRAGANYAKIELETLPLLKNSVEAANGAGVDLVVLSLHWGPNMRIAPPQEFREFARGALDLGVDIVHGHSAHIFQGIERHGDGLIMYDTGDFLDDYAIDPILRNDWSFIFLVEVENGKVKGLRMVPVLLSYARVDLARGVDTEAIRRRMKRLSRDLGSEISETVEGLEL